MKENPQFWPDFSQKIDILVKISIFWLFSSKLSWFPSALVVPYHVLWAGGVAKNMFLTFRDIQTPWEHARSDLRWYGGEIILIKKSWFFSWFSLWIWELQLYALFKGCSCFWLNTISQHEQAGFAHRCVTWRNGAQHNFQFCSFRTWSTKYVSKL